MHATPDATRIAAAAIDLVKDVFKLVYADAQGQLIERQRLSRNPILLNRNRLSR